MAPTDRRAAVMQAALALFAERGFHGTRVPDVAERAGVATGTIYRYFATKEALVNAIYRDRKLAHAEAVARSFDASLPAEQQVVDAWRAMVAVAHADPVAFRFLELHHHADYLDADSRAASDQAIASPLAFVTAGQDAGLLRKDLGAAVLTSLVWGALVGFLRDHPTPQAEVVDAAGFAIWRMVAA